MDKEAVLGASPEMLVRCRGQQLDYRPIAGTRARGATEIEDKRLGEEMRADEKEVAEHVMLVDLGRNDLGRVAEYGSVQVEELMAIERYSHVQHLVSSLSAQLRDGLDRFDALAACFPAGTVTGAPKVRAMEIIHQLEPTPRGVYCGCGPLRGLRRQSGFMHRDSDVGVGPGRHGFGASRRRNRGGFNSRARNERQ